MAPAEVFLCLANLDPFLDYLLSDSRRIPVVLVSTDPVSDRPLVSADSLAGSLAGLANVAVMETKYVSFRITDRLGKPFSCFNGAVRLYWPHVDLGADPFHHPIWLPGRIAALRDIRGLYNQMLRFVASVASFRFTEAPGVKAFRAQVGVERRERLRRNIPHDYDEVVQMWMDSDDRVQELLGERANLIAENDNLKANLVATHRYLEPEAVRPAEPGDFVEEPVRSVREAVERAAAMAIQTVYAPSAYESADTSPFVRPQEVLEALLAIDEVACSWAESIESGRSMGKDLVTAFAEKGQTYRDDISQTSKTKWREDYQFVFEGIRLPGYPHITLGSGSADTCLSVHWLWDERVVC